MKRKFDVLATRTYYSTLSFVVEARDYDEARKIAEQKIEDCEVEYGSIDSYAEEDEIEIFEHIS